MWDLYSGMACVEEAQSTNWANFAIFCSDHSQMPTWGCSKPAAPENLTRDEPAGTAQPYHFQ
jgi:hypothetical protein